MASGLVVAALALGGCGVSVAAGGANAATHPASGEFVSPTVGGDNVSGSDAPVPPVQLPASTPPASLPSGLSGTVSALERSLSGGCWQNAHAGSVYGAYDQVFWWQGDCGDTFGMVDVQLYPTTTAAQHAAHHAVTSALLDRYIDGAVLVDVYTSAPLSVLSALSSGQRACNGTGYGS